MGEAANPEIGSSIRTGDITTNYHDVGAGTGPPVLLLHGSGPGVSAWANWRLTIGDLSDRFRLLAPDLAGFGYSTVPDGIEYRTERWLAQIVDFLDAVGVDQVDVVGNSFGGSMALGLLIQHPDRVRRAALMGSVGVPFTITEGLDAVWGYQPSVAAMGALLRETFAFDAELITDELVEMRYAASIRPGVQESFSSMFPAPRQRWVDAMAHDEAAIRAIGHQVLIIHGRDDKVIPLQNSLTLLDWIEHSQLHVFGRCGHWTQIEHAEPFAAQLARFFG